MMAIVAISGSSRSAARKFRGFERHFLKDGEIGLSQQACEQAS